MAAPDIVKEAIFDNRIYQDSKVRFAVSKGGLSYTTSRYDAIGATSSQHTYAVSVPSQSVFVARDINWTSTTYLQFNVAVNTTKAPFAANTPVIRIGQDVALCAFPLQSMVNSLTAQVNDTSITSAMDLTMKEVLRLTDYRKNRKQRTCPTALDKYASYDDALLAGNSPLAGFADAVDSDLVGNGAYWNVEFTDAQGASLKDYGAAGSYTIGGITVNYDAQGIPLRAQNVNGAEPAAYPLFIKFTSTEKLLLSPFIYADGYDHEVGMMGINTMNFTMTMGSPARILRNCTAAGSTISNVAFNFNKVPPFSNNHIDVLYITPSLDLPLPAKSVCNYCEFPSFRTVRDITIAAGKTERIESNAFTLNQIPDLLLVAVKPQFTGDMNNYGDFYLPITKVSLNWDNYAGLCSTMTREQLYQASHYNGLDMDYNQWCGKAYSGGKQVATSGGFIILRPGQDFALQAGQAPGLGGQFVLQYSVDVVNQTSVAWKPVLQTIAVYSGFFESANGASRVVRTMLNEAQVINAPMAAEQTHVGLERIVGGGFFSKLGSALAKAKDLYTSTKPMISSIKNALPGDGKLGMIKDALSSVGYGQHAGAGGMAGAGRKKLSDRVL